MALSKEICFWGMDSNTHLKLRDHLFANLMK